MVGRPKMPMEVRFFKYVEPEMNSGCWLWSGALNAEGYGHFGIGAKVRRAHRVSWEIAHGPIPEGTGYHGSCLLHRCDTPACVNPGHLKVGTQAENLKEMQSRKRVTRKITEEQFAEATAMKSDGSSCAAIARKYGVSAGYMVELMRNGSYFCVTRPRRSRINAAGAPRDLVLDAAEALFDSGRELVG